MTGLDRINRMLASTHKKLYWNAILRAFGLPILASLIWLGLSLVGLLDRLPVKLDALLTVIAIGLLVILWLRGFLRFRSPDKLDAKARVDAISETRPATSLLDRPVQAAGKSYDLWKAHRDRVIEELKSLKAPSLWTDIQKTDPYFLRFIAPVAFIAVMVLAGGQAPSRLMTAFKADFGSLLGAENIRIQAWMTPPSYTGRAPFDVDADTLIRSPIGTQFTLRVDAPSAPTVKIVHSGGEKSFKIKQGKDGIFEEKMTLDLNTDMDIQLHWWGQRASYSVSTKEDRLPSIEFEETPKGNDTDKLTFAWKASDDYGLTGVELSLRLQKPPEDGKGLEENIPLDIPGVEPKAAKQSENLNLTRHKWAGLPVYATLRATDAAGQSGETQPVAFTLPEKLFLQPMAQAAMEVRATVLREPEAYQPLDTSLYDDDTDESVASIDLPRSSKLERAPDDVRKAALMLDALTYEPDSYFNDRMIYLGLRQARSILSSAGKKVEADQSESVLWAVALRAEYGTLADAAKALENARKALEKALRDGASEEKIERLMQAYKQAVENYLDMRMAEAIRRGIDPSELDGPEMGGKSVNGSDLERMMQALEDLTETGAHDQARQLLSDMTQMLENLQDFKLSQGQNGEPQEMDTPMSKALERLAEELRKQRDLNDDTNQAMRDQNQSGMPQDGQTSPGTEPQSGNTGQSMQELAERQRALSESQNGSASESDEMGEAGSASEQGTDSAMARAREAQRRAAEALERGDMAEAQLYQQQATRELTEAATQMAEQADQMREGMQSENEANQQQTDPLGRPSGNNLIGDGDDVVVPEEMDRQKARDILDELRRRSAEQGLTQEELDYLLRLLDRF